MTSHNIQFEPLGKKDRCVEDESILACSQRLGLGLNSVCGGQGTCHSCKLQLVSGTASEITSNERDAFSAEELKQGWRLACRVFPRGDCRFYIPVESMTTMQRLQVEGMEVTLGIDPPVNSFNVELDQPSLTDPQADADRVMASISAKIKGQDKKVDIDVLRELSPRFRLWQGKFDVITRSDEIIAVMPPKNKLIGLAVDIGSTKIATYLVDLRSGETLASRGSMNPQVSYGDDIVSRITNTIKNPETGVKLQQLVVEAINTATEEMCRKLNIDPGEIIEAAIAGNTVMHHLFLGLPVKQLAISPFVSAINAPVNVKARDTGLKIGHGAYIYMLPNIAGFVGADHIAVLLAIEAGKIKKPTIALDIGTNTEISLIYNGEITSVSCASGPAFEGGHIKSGMRAASGAVERVQISGDKISVQTIDNEPPVGICGSGILDAIAQMYLNKIIDSGGKMINKNPRVHLVDGIPEYVLVKAKEHGNREPLVVGQRDIREIQLAKAAIRTGIEILMKARGLNHGQLQQVIIAGAFGTYITLESAVILGMLPPVSIDKFRQVGNAAGIGSKIALLSLSKRQEAAELFSRIGYIELASFPDFMKIYLQCNYFGKYIIEDNIRKEV